MSTTKKLATAKNAFPKKSAPKKGKTTKGVTKPRSIAVVEDQAIEPSANLDGAETATAVETPPTNKTKTKSKAKLNADAQPKTTTKKLSAIDAAAQVLAAATEPLNAKQMIEAMAAQKLWTSPGGQTPHATLYSAILREIGAKGDAARFKKADRGLFAANAKA